MTSAIQTFNKLSPRIKSLYVTSLVLSVALMVFGAVLLTGMSNGNNSNNLTNIASENYAADGGEDLIGSDNNNNSSTINLDDPVVNEEPLFFSNDYAELPKTPYPTWSYPSSIPTLEPSKYLHPLVQPTTDLSSSSMFPTTIASSIDPTTTVIVQYTTDPTQQPSSVSPTKETITYNPTDSPAERPSSTSPTEIEVTYNPSPSPTEIEVTYSPTEQPSSSTPTDQDTTYNPTQSPSVRPSPTPLDTIITISPTDVIDAPVTTSNPTATATATATEPTTSSPTQSPTQPEPTESEPIDLTSTLPYFNYDTQSPYGPNQWQNIQLDNSTRTNYWSEFNLVENQCNSMDGKNSMQSPIDVCTQPERHCKEYHEFRSKRGDFRIDDDAFMIKQILPNKLRVLVARRTGEEPDPPHVDFAGIGASNLDLLNSGACVGRATLPL